MSEGKASPLCGILIQLSWTIALSLLNIYYYYMVTLTYF